MKQNINEVWDSQEISQEGVKKIDEVTQIVSSQVSWITGFYDKDIKEQVSLLKERNIISSSFYAKLLIKTIDYLKKYLWIDIKIWDKKWFEKETNCLSLWVDDIISYKKTSWAILWLWTVLLPSIVLGWWLEAGTAITTASYSIINWELIIPILLILWVSSWAAYKIKKDKIKNWSQDSWYDLKKDVEVKFDEYSKIDWNIDPEWKEKAKKAIIETTMSELPLENEGVEKDIEIKSIEELNDIVELKNGVDDGINKIFKLIEEMNIKKWISFDELHIKKEEIINKIVEYLKYLEDIKTNLENDMRNHDKNDYIYKQIEYEIKKIEYIKQHLILLQKKWLILVQTIKNEIITSIWSKNVLGFDHDWDRIISEIEDIKNKINNALNKDILEDKIEEEIKGLNDELKTKIEEAEKLKLPWYSEEKEILWWNELILHNNWKFLKNIKYSINWDEKNIHINDNLYFEIWITDEWKIKMNYSVNWVLVELKDLEIKNNDLFILGTLDTLEDFIKSLWDTSTSDLSISKDLPQDSAEIMKSLFDKLNSVKQEIVSWTYNTFWDAIEIDKDAIDHQRIIIDKWYFWWKEKLSMSFALTESYWKHALSNLNKTSGAYSVNYQFEWSNNIKSWLSIPVRRFDIGTWFKKVTVLVTDSNNWYKALEWEVKIFFDPLITYNQDDITNIMQEIAWRLVITDHMVSVDSESSDYQVKKLIEARRSWKKSWKKVKITKEKESHVTEITDINKLKEMGLHSIYEHFDISQLEQIFKSEALISTKSRWSKWILIHWMSSTTDMTNGWATSVFTRILTNNAVKKWLWYNSSPCIIFDPSLFERLDCYCFASDKFGSKLPWVFDQRLSPEKLVQSMSSSYNTWNEVMFHDTISIWEASKYIKYLVYDQPKKIIERLKKIWITKIWGKPLEEAVISREKFKTITL